MDNKGSTSLDQAQHVARAFGPRGIAQGKAAEPRQREDGHAGGRPLLLPGADDRTGGTR
jgi:hypothetical protein